MGGMIVEMIDKRETIKVKYTCERILEIPVYEFKEMCEEIIDSEGILLKDVEKLINEKNIKQIILDRFWHNWVHEGEVLTEWDDAVKWKLEYLDGDGEETGISIKEYRGV